MGNPMTNAEMWRLLDDRIKTVYWDRFNGLPMN